MTLKAFPCSRGLNPCLGRIFFCQASDYHRKKTIGDEFSESDLDMVDDHGSQLFRFRPRNENWRTQLKGQIQEIPIADDVLEIKVKHSLVQTRARRFYSFLKPINSFLKDYNSIFQRKFPSTNLRFFSILAAINILGINM